MSKLLVCWCVLCYLSIGILVSSHLMLMLAPILVVCPLCHLHSSRTLLCWRDVPKKIFKKNYYKWEYKYFSGHWCRTVEICVGHLNWGNFPSQSNILSAQKILFFPLFKHLRSLISKCNISKNTKSRKSQKCG